MKAAVRSIAGRTAVAAVFATLVAHAGMVQAAEAEGSPLPQAAALSPEFPFESKFVEVLGSRMHYIDEGEGDPILFLHGNPTSSYLWRNVIPFVQPMGRVIAVDNIGFGRSDKPDLDYTFADHSRHIEGFVDALGLQNITLVLHDWGSVLGLDYARRNEDRVKAVAFMEALVPPAFPMQSYKDFGSYEETFRGFRDPVKGPEMIVEQNVFIEGLMPGAILRPLSEAEMTAYRAPFLEPASRKPILVWPNELPIEGEPQRNVEIITAIGEWLGASATPKLLQYASPGAIVTPETANWAAANYRNLETQFIGYGLHYVQEDNPEAIGRGIADWMRRLPK